jgi:hypothetical protein
LKRITFLRCDDVNAWRKEEVAFFIEGGERKTRNISRRRRRRTLDEDTLKGEERNNNIEGRKFCKINTTTEKEERE